MSESEVHCCRHLSYSEEEYECMETAYVCDPYLAQADWEFEFDGIDGSESSYESESSCESESIDDRIVIPVSKIQQECFYGTLIGLKLDYFVRGRRPFPKFLRGCDRFRRYFAGVTVNNVSGD